ncbi:MAG: hypothetical protein RIT17_1244, partial [Pseudomonadota bacterium]
QTLVWWGWLAGSGAIFVAYLWLAIRKITDQ